MTSSPSTQFESTQIVRPGPHRTGSGQNEKVVAVWSELGDCRRFARSDQAVRHTGLDVSVDASDRRRAGGYLSRQGPQTLRWALYEAAKNSSHHRSPDHDYYAQVKKRHGGKIAAISVARKLTRCCYHILREIDADQVYLTTAV
jgi:transposase